MKKLLFLTIASLLALPMGLSAANPYILKKGDKKPTEYKKIELKNDKTYRVTYLKGGAGDVLSGMIAAMLCRLPAREAVITAVWLHGRAGDICEAQFGEDGVLATDVIRAIPEAMQEISERK